MLTQVAESFNIDNCILDFAVTNRYLATTSTDFKLRIYDHSTGRLEYTGYIEGSQNSYSGLATSICLFENLESEIDISSTDRLGTDYTYLALGMMNTTIVYKYDFRYKTLSHLATIVGHVSYVAGI